MITVRKLKLKVLGENKEEINEGYRFIRDSQYAQYRGLNIAMGYYMTMFYMHRDLNSEEYKNAISEFKFNLSNPLFEGINFGTGVDTPSAMAQKVKKDFSTALKNGLAKGERGATNYKKTFPLITRGRQLKFRYSDNGKTIILKWVNKIEFEVITGHRVNEELLHTMHKVINGEYKVGQSSLEFDRNNKLILNLTINMPDKEVEEFIPGRVLGVDLGISVPAYASVSDSPYVRSRFGTFEEFAKVRTQFQSRRKRLQQQLALAKGGKGRKDKLSAMNQLRDKESNFAKTYNHMLSSRIVKFAKDNQCEFIHMEKLDGTDLDKRVLGLWSYYQLQEYIEYKAEREGIKVKFVDPAYTSQKCSRCEHIDKENRKTQADFECVKCGHKMNADHNASINIARSKKFKK